MTITVTPPDTLVREVSDWLYAEAELLDGRQFEDWLRLLADDLHYVVPLRVTRQREIASDFVAGMAHMDEDKTSMEMRVARLTSDYAWAEDPPSRTRHFVSNIRVSPDSADGCYLVKSNLLLYRSCGDQATFDLLCGERRDVLRRVGESLELVRREVLLDQTTLPTHNLSVFL